MAGPQRRRRAASNTADTAQRIPFDCFMFIIYSCLVCDYKIKAPDPANKLWRRCASTSSGAGRSGSIPAQYDKRLTDMKNCGLAGVRTNVTLHVAGLSKFADGG
jgi:hypothetical protein